MAAEIHLPKALTSLKRALATPVISVPVDFVDAGAVIFKHLPAQDLKLREAIAWIRDAFKVADNDVPHPVFAQQF